MHYKKLPHTDIKVSLMCLGSMNWGQQNSEAQAHEQLDYATANGVNFIDTAEMYPVPPTRELQGTTERFIGSWLKKAGQARRPGDRKQGRRVRPRQHARAFGQGRTVYDRANIRAAVEGSLSRLGTDYLGPLPSALARAPHQLFRRAQCRLIDETISTPIEETLGALTELVKRARSAL